jgi:hypothetical protein
MLAKTFVLTALAAAVIAAPSMASAAIVCNSENVCWHTHHHYNYHPEWGVVVHEDNWRAGPNDHQVWREHSGRGYWRNGVWIRF